MSTYICTTGTSVAAPVRSGEVLITFDPQDPEAYRRSIRQRLNLLRASLGSSFLKKSCAEANSLQQAGAKAGDEIVLLHSETADGRICAEEVGVLVEKELRAKSQLREVKGLQVNDAAAFRRIGIPNLIRALETANSAAQGEVILNATGGFKSVVPYITLFGLLRRLPIVYLHETAQALIRLPPAPISFDFERLGQARRAILRLRQEGLMEKEAFFALIPGLAHHEHSYFETLLEEVDGLVAPSGLASLLFKDQDEHLAEVYISPQARASLENSSGVPHEQYIAMLERVADPLWREHKIHPVQGTDLTVFKPGNTSERMLAIVRPSRIYVCELAQHNVYEKLISSRRESSYRLEDFTPWIRPIHEPDPPSSEEEDTERLRERLATAEKNWYSAEERLETAGSCLKSTQNELDASRSREAILTSANQRLEQSFSALRLTLDKQQEAWSRYRMLPWWRRALTLPPADVEP